MAKQAAFELHGDLLFQKLRIVLYTTMSKHSLTVSSHSMRSRSACLGSFRIDHF